jgi:MFS superfamily sulfate permease-like transporter
MDAVHLTDTDGADILIQVAHDLEAKGVRLVLANVHVPVLALWRRAGVLDAIGEDAVFTTDEEAVDAVASIGAQPGEPDHPARVMRRRPARETMSSGDPPSARR